ncbi:YjzC family protein [Parasediminibacterium paludis]|uniref:YjzC family protein n=1 Tax=Parasediminibacterium paludis TaxID=908966 RepID=A0ABV8PVS7_9BACT
MAEIYKPGDEVPNSGIYKVVHDNVHTEPHEVTCIKGNRFPPCNHCGKHPQFTLVRAAWHINNHPSFK